MQRDYNERMEECPPDTAARACFGPADPSAPQLRLRRRSIVIGVISVLWLTLVFVLMLALIEYSNQPGQMGIVPLAWPEDSSLKRDRSRPELVMFVHPRCSCSRASLDELERLIAECEGRFHASVLFIQPDGMAADWARTDLWRSAAAIPGVTVKLDRSGAEARRFGSLTSGQVMLYAPDGRLMFRGGITMARGHEGDNPGRAALRAMLRGETVTTAAVPVFGCALFDGGFGREVRP